MTTVEFTTEQVAYIFENLGAPNIPETKDLEIREEILIQIASAKSMAEYQSGIAEKQKESLLKIAKIIIAKKATGRESFVEQEWVNILRRQIDVEITSDEVKIPFHRLIFNKDHTRSYYLVSFNEWRHQWEVWETHEGKKYPWCDPTDPEPFLVFTDEGLETIDHILENKQDAKRIFKHRSV